MDGWTDDLPWLGQYVLDEQGNPMPAAGLMEWAQWMETADRQVALTKFAGGIVSTIFLGLDMNFLFGPESDPLHYKPVLWETMVFGGSLDREQPGSPANDLCSLGWERRYASRDEALAGHEEMVERCRAAISI